MLAGSPFITPDVFLFMIILGFEGSANKLGIGIIRDGVALVNARITYSPPTGHGFKISDAAYHHQKGLFPLFKQSLHNAGIRMEDVNYLAYTMGPGIGPCLRVVSVFVKTVSSFYGIPVIPVNHCVAHIEMGRHVTGASDPVVLYVSGGNTQVIAYARGRYRILGETLDVAAGNALDKLARMLGLPNEPSPGFNVEACAKKGKECIRLPYCVKGMDVSISGLVSYLKNYLENIKLTDQIRADVCYSLQETMFAMLVEVTERAMAATGSKEVLVVGGVGCNKRLQDMAASMARDRGAAAFSADERYCIDNGLMIAHTAQKMIEACHQITDESQECQIQQRWRTDTVPITWRTTQ